MTFTPLVSERYCWWPLKPPWTQLTFNSQASVEKFKRVASETAQGSRRNTRYLHEYSLYQIAMIEGDMLTAEKHRITAKRMGASTLYTEELPIMDQSVLTLPGD